MASVLQKMNFFGLKFTMLPVLCGSAGAHTHQSLRYRRIGCRSRLHPNEAADHHRATAVFRQTAVQSCLYHSRTKAAAICNDLQPRGCSRLTRFRATAFLQIRWKYRLIFGHIDADADHQPTRSPAPDQRLSVKIPNFFSL